MHAAGGVRLIGTARRDLIGEGRGLFRRVRHVAMVAARGGARQAGEAFLRTGMPRDPLVLLPGLFNNSYRLPSAS